MATALASPSQASPSQGKPAAVSAIHVQTPDAQTDSRTQVSLGSSLFKAMRTTAPRNLIGSNIFNLPSCFPLLKVKIHCNMTHPKTSPNCRGKGGGTMFLNHYWVQIWTWKWDLESTSLLSLPALLVRPCWPPGGALSSNPCCRRCSVWQPVLQEGLSFPATTCIC